MVSRGAARTDVGWPLREVLIGCYLLALAGCGEGGGLIAGAIVGSAATRDGGDHRGRHNGPSTVPDFEGDPSDVQVKAVRLRSTAGGCEVDVTFTNVSGKSRTAGFSADILDAGGRRVTSRSTAMQLAAPGDTKTVSSEGTTAGPSGIPCPSGGQARVTQVSVLNF